MTNTTEEAAAFLKKQKDSPTQNWRGLCLQLQRMARDIPAVYPSALAASVATPASERVYKVGDLRRGMVAYSDDPNDSNPYAHIYFIAGWKSGVLRSDANADKCWVYTNDAPYSGRVGIVPLTYFREHWGDGFLFGATWLNGYNFSEFDAKPTPVAHRATLGDNYQHALEDVRKAIHFHEKAGHDKLVKVLQRDLDRMTKHFGKYSG